MFCSRPTIWFSLSLIFLSVVGRTGAGEPNSAVDDWPGWRGPNGNGVANEQQEPPLHWSKTENVIWKAAVPGRGHSSPTVFGKQVFLATADEEADMQSVLAFDRGSGERLWKTDVRQGGIERKGNKKASQASSTVACDGERLFINFLNNNAVYTTALDLSGKQLWQTKVVDYRVHQGFGSSPILYGNLVLATVDSHLGGAVAALDRKTGDIVWQHERPEQPNYTSPIVLRAAGKDQLVQVGCDLVTSFDPLSGKKHWEVEGATTECVTSVVTDGERIFFGGGYPKKFTQAMQADGSGKVDWENNSQVYVPSMIVHGAHVYAVLDNGLAACWKCDTGKEAWKTRLGSGFTASLVLVGDLLFAIDESAKAFVFKASPDKLTVVAENQLGEEAYATPAICGGRIYLRVVGNADGLRQEMLYCLGKR